MSTLLVMISVLVGGANPHWQQSYAWQSAPIRMQECERKIHPLADKMRAAGDGSPNALNVKIICQPEPYRT